MNLLSREFPVEMLDTFGLQAVNVTLQDAIDQVNKIIINRL